MADQSVTWAHWAVVICKNRAVGKEKGGGWDYDVCRARQHRRGEEGSWGLLKIETGERWGRGGETGDCAKSDVGRARKRKNKRKPGDKSNLQAFLFILRIRHALIH